MYQMYRNKGSPIIYVLGGRRFFRGPVIFYLQGRRGAGFSYPHGRGARYFLLTQEGGREFFSDMFSENVSNSEKIDATVR